MTPFVENRIAIEPSDLDACPDNVKNYLKRVGVVGQQRKVTAHILHAGEFRMKPKQKWFSIQGNYKFNLEEPSFTWHAVIKLFPLIFVSVKDEYNNGIGRSLVKLLSLFTIGDQTGKEINESSLGRLLIEFIMIPTALVPSERLKWHAVSTHQARVTLRNNGIEVSAVFEFGPDGLPLNTRIDRYGNFEGRMTKKPFVCIFSKYKTMGGLLIPSDIIGGWDLGNEIFNWFHFVIKTVRFL